MDYLTAIFLGVIQGVTEFLPISSSGHLVVFQQIFDVKLHDEALLTFDVALHFGTLIAVVAVFYREIWEIISGCLPLTLTLSPNGRGNKIGNTLSPRGRGKGEGGINVGARMALLIIIGTIPAGVLGVIFEEPLEKLFSNVAAVGWMWLFTGAFLFATKWDKLFFWGHVTSTDLINAGTQEGDAGGGPSMTHSNACGGASISGGVRRQDPLGGIYETSSGTCPRKKMTIKQSLIVGFAQALAILPGISRSGATISAGIFSGLDRELAVRFSFLLAIPVIAGGALLKLNVLLNFNRKDLGATLAGFFAAMIVGYISLKFLMGIVKRGKLHWFAFYCWTAGVIAVIVSL